MRFYERFFVLISLAAAVFVGASLRRPRRWPACQLDHERSRRIFDGRRRKRQRAHRHVAHRRRRTATLGVPGIIGTAVSLPGNATGSGAGYYISVPASSVWVDRPT